MNTTTAEKIADAAQRILQGHPLRSSGKITVADLAREAGLSRATVNKSEYRHLVDQFRSEAAMAPSGETSAEVWRDRYGTLERAMTDHKKGCSNTINELEERVQRLAHTIQMQSLLIEHLRNGGVDPTPLSRKRNLLDSAGTTSEYVGPEHAPGEPLGS